MSILIYLLIGLIYLIVRFHQDLLPLMWSPMQPLSVIILWPIMIVIDIISIKKRKP